MVAGLTHSIQISRYGSTVDAEGTPYGNASAVGNTVLGFVHEFSSTELETAATLDEQIIARALLPYGTSVQDQDVLTVTFADNTTTRSYRVVAVRDNFIMLHCDLARDVI